MIFTTETTTDVAPDALLTLLYSKYAGRRYGSSENTADAKKNMQTVKKGCDFVSILFSFHLLGCL